MPNCLSPTDKYFLKFSPNKENYSLLQMCHVLERLGSFHLTLPVIHVAGTNGKGSVCAMLTAILKEAGYRVGTYTSPHLLTVRERISLHGVSISEAALVDIVEKYQSYFEGLSYFEVITLCAFLYFAQSNVDIIILETGMGGRLDATNICQPLVTAITNVGWDHMHHLGYSLEAILKEKAGICKKNTPLVTGIVEDTLREILKQNVGSLDIPIYFLNDDFSYELTHHSYPHKNNFKYYSPNVKFSMDELSWWTTYHGKNAALAMKVVELLKEQNFPVSYESIEKGFKTYYWPGRMEIMNQNPLVIFDCAHNEHGAHELAHSLKTYYGERHAIFLIAISKDKEWHKMLQIFSDISHDIYVVPYAQDRSWDVACAPSKFKRFSSIKEGYQQILSTMGKDDLLCLTGSIYAVAEAKQSLCD